ncbi:MAG TPA: polyhydroxyalkanoic acid system family protein [Candidatus Paceibacterota bacterium]|jgi:hypothetical protein|nr:polyhydroxyalkanoic acid system family protein [Candidatus Paceibacterota bacterium]
MQITIPHKLGSAAAAKQKVVQALSEARAKIGDQATIDKEQWDGDILNFAFTAQGQSISGTFEVRDNEFELNAKLPLMLRMFEGKIKSTIEAQAGALLK